MSPINPFIYQACSDGAIRTPDIPVHARRHFGQCAEDLIIASLLRALVAREGTDLTEQRYLEIGANHPIATSATYLLSTELGMRGVLVEANPDLIADLIKIRSNDIVRHAAVTTSNEAFVELFVSNQNELSSLSRRFVEEWQEGSVGLNRIETVPALRIDQLLREEFGSTAPSFLSIDIEGMDLDILMDMDWSTWRPAIIQVEPSDHFHPNNSAAIADFLGSRGYLLVARTEVNLIAIDRTRLSVHEQRQNPELSAISTTSQHRLREGASLQQSKASSVALILSDFSEESVGELDRFADRGGKTVILAPNAPKGKPTFEIPSSLFIMDLRYGAPNIVYGNHPRLEGIWTQFPPSATGLARGVTLSGAIDNDTPTETGCSQSVADHNVASRPEPADHSPYAGHYQLLHAEVYNFSQSLNGVAIWGDAAALAPGSRTSGGRFSARSCPVKWSGYTPPEYFDSDDQAFDATLVGVEIDIFNAGKPCPTDVEASDEAMQKVALQIVGFGNRSTAAIEVRSEDTHNNLKGPEDRNGSWQSGLVMHCALSSTSTVLAVVDGTVRRGIDFDRVRFSDGAFRVAGFGPRTGVIFDDGHGGELYSEICGNGHRFCLRAGDGGLRLLNSAGTEVLMEIRDDHIWIKKEPEPRWRAARILKRLRAFFA